MKNAFKFICLLAAALLYGSAMGPQMASTSSRTPFFNQVPPLLASVPRNPDGPRQIHRFPHFLIADFSLSGQRLPVISPKTRR